MSLLQRCRVIKGFTLIELMLVAVILVVAAAVAVPNFVKTAGRLELRRAAEDVAYTIRYGQLRAMTKGHTLRLNIDARGYWLEEDRTSPTDDSSVNSGPVYERIRDQWGRRTDFPTEISLAQTGQPIIFSPDGRMAPVELQLCRAQQCLIVSTGQQRGRVNILDPEEVNTNATL